MNRVGRLGRLGGGLPPLIGQCERGAQYGSHEDGEGGDSGRVRVGDSGQSQLLAHEQAGNNTHSREPDRDHTHRSTSVDFLRYYITFNEVVNS